MSPRVVLDMGYYCGRGEWQFRLSTTRMAWNKHQSSFRLYETDGFDGWFWSNADIEQVLRDSPGISRCPPKLCNLGRVVLKKGLLLPESHPNKLFYDSPIPGDSHWLTKGILLDGLQAGKLVLPSSPCQEYFLSPWTWYPQRHLGA